MDKIDPLDLARSSAAVAVMTYVVAEIPQRLTSSRGQFSDQLSSSHPGRLRVYFFEGIHQVVGPLQILLGWIRGIHIVDRQHPDDHDAAAGHPAAGALRRTDPEIAVERTVEVDDRVAARRLVDRLGNRIPDRSSLTHCAK